MIDNKKNNKGEERFPTGASLLRYELKGSAVFFAASMLLSAAVSVIDLINPKIISCVIDYILGSEKLPEDGIGASLIAFFGGTEHIKTHLYIPALCVIVVALTGALARYFQEYLNRYGAEKLVRRMRDTLYSHAEKLKMSWYSANSTGDILQRCTSDVETVKQFVSAQLTSFARTVLMIILSMVFMVGIDPFLTLIAAAFIPVIVGYSLIFHVKIGAAFLEADTQEGVVSSIVQENLTGNRVIRAFGKEAFECERFFSTNEEYTDLWKRLMRLLSRFWALGDVMSGFQVMTVVAVGAAFCVSGRITAGSYIAFVSYNAMLVWPVRELGRTIADLSRAGVSIERIRYILNAVPEELDDHDIGSGEKYAPLIEFSHVDFHYPGSADVLNDICMKIERGEKIGIIGGTGSGKTTIIDILMRMYGNETLSGSVRRCGKDIFELPLAGYRNTFSRVLQEPFLLSGTISYNIGISDEDLSDEQIRSAADDSALTQAAEKFTEGFDTFVGERGVTLSGGQKQRCAVAAALAKDAEIYIFDDAFSALDAETENTVRKNIYRRLDGKTVIIISHRISTISGCDRIYVLDKGRIADVGKHDELISRKGVYRDIYELQSGQ